MSKKVLLIGLVLLIAGLVLVTRYVDMGSIAKLSSPLPSATPYRDIVSKSPTPKTLTTPSLKEINLDIPFTSQAPFGNWNEPYQNFCEEASVLMAMSYVKGETLSPAVADSKMLAIKAFEDQRFGDYLDTDVAQTAIIIKEFYKYSKVSILKDPSIAAVKKALSEGKAVIIPVAGRELGNPYYTQPGPLYHMLIIKGYTTNGKFITNDPGTRHGADYIYDADVLWNAMHDWNNGNVNAGAKAVIIVG